jgi:hypothetical protein
MHNTGQKYLVECAGDGPPAGVAVVEEGGGW